MTKPPYPIGANPPPAPPRFTHQVGRVLGAPHPDWPEDLASFAERSAYQRGVADARYVDAPHLQAVKSVLMRMRDRWWPFVHGAIGASQTARALLKESADVLNYETPAPGEYRTTAGRAFHFDGWPPGESPIELFDAGKWLECLHACMFAASRRELLEDDHLLHELVHLALGIDICTHNTMAGLREAGKNLQE